MSIRFISFSEHHPTTPTGKRQMKGLRASAGAYLGVREVVVRSRLRLKANEFVQRPLHLLRRAASDIG